MLMKAVQHCTESILFFLTSEQTCLLDSAAFAVQPRGVFLQDTPPRWHFCQIILAQWWCRKSRREKAREGGLFSSARTSGAAAFTQSKAYGRGSRPLPALPASITPATIPLVSQQAVDFYRCYVSLRCVEGAYFHGLQTLEYAVQCGVCWEVIYWQCRLPCKIHTCCCQGFLSKHEQNKMSCSTVALSCLCAVSSGWFRGAIS